MGLHALAAMGTVVLPTSWPWMFGAIGLNHLVLGGFGMCPRSRLLGPNLVRLPDASALRGEVALTFDDGPDPRVTPLVLDLLDRYGARASFFCIGRSANAYPDLVREIASRGHFVENHSQNHPKAFACYPPALLMREVRQAQETIARITERSPRFFRPPAGLRSPLLDAVVRRLGLRHTSWTRRGFDTLSGDAVTVLRRLIHGLAGGDVLLLHDGGSKRTRQGQPVVLAVLPALLDRIAASGLRSVPLAAALGVG